MIPSAKRCPRCLVTKDSDQFYHVTRLSGKQRGQQFLASYCKPCNRGYHDEWVTRDTPVTKKYNEKKSAYAKRWRGRNKSKVKELWATYSKENRVALREKARVRRAACQ